MGTQGRPGPSMWHPELPLCPFILCPFTNEETGSKAVGTEYWLQVQHRRGRLLPVIQRATDLPLAKTARGDGVWGPGSQRGQLGEKQQRSPLEDPAPWRTVALGKSDHI